MMDHLPAAFPFPYVWRDVAVVHLLAALPLVLLLARSSSRRAAATAGAAALPLVAGIALFLTATGHPAGGFLLRVVLALAVMLAVSLAIVVIFGRLRKRPDESASQSIVSGAITSLLILLLVPAIYVAARQRDDAVRLQGLLQQSRLGEALALADAMLALEPGTHFQNQPLRGLRADLAQTVGGLTARVAEPLSSLATNDQRLNRARDFAILGRTDEAIGVLSFWPAASAPPQASTLLGTIHEAREDWSSGVNSYQRALQGWRAAEASLERDAQLIQATQGVAYCQRKLGHYAAAKAAYEQLLTLSPTADTHFLLAQFYEDVQQTGPAAEHARRAMALAPERYQQAGEQLLDKLVTLHFGCWGL